MSHGMQYPTPATSQPASQLKVGHRQHGNDHHEEEEDHERLVVVAAAVVVVVMQRCTHTHAREHARTHTHNQTFALELSLAAPLQKIRRQTRTLKTRQATGSLV